MGGGDGGPVHDMVQNPLQHMVVQPCKVFCAARDGLCMADVAPLKEEANQC
jgi:hypothetical protein